ncbi:MAG: hypothetical protein ACM3X6_06590 [Patescibacteria group bacterium]
MRELPIIAVLLGAGAMGCLAWPRLAGLMSKRTATAVRLALAVAAVLAALDFARPWVFPLALGLFVGSYLAHEAARPGSGPAPGT